MRLKYRSASYALLGPARSSYSALRASSRRRRRLPADKPKFEVASVRENTADDGKVMIGIQPGGRFNAVNVPLWDLIRQAYRDTANANRGRAGLGGNRALRHRRQGRRRDPANAARRAARPAELHAPGSARRSLQASRASRDTRDADVCAHASREAIESSGRDFARRPSTAPRCAGAERAWDVRGLRRARRLLASARTCGMRMAPNQVTGGRSAARAAHANSVPVHPAHRASIARASRELRHRSDVHARRMPQGPPPPGVPPLVDRSERSVDIHRTAGTARS